MVERFSFKKLGSDDTRVIGGRRWWSTSDFCTYFAPFSVCATTNIGDRSRSNTNIREQISEQPK